MRVFFAAMVLLIVGLLGTATYLAAKEQHTEDVWKRTCRANGNWVVVSATHHRLILVGKVLVPSTYHDYACQDLNGRTVSTYKE